MSARRSKTTSTSLTPEIANTAITAIADHISLKRLITGPALEHIVAEAFGVPASSGSWDWRMAYDLMEGAAAAALLRKGGDASPEALTALARRLPTQTRRSEGQIRLQQFSTPLALAALAARAAELRADDVVLEPSAGCGAMAAFAHLSGASAHLNELDPARRIILSAVFGQTATAHDGALINDLYRGAERPTVVLMNPPFSSSLDKSGDKRIAGRHLNSAFTLLPVGGRIAAIMPAWFTAKGDQAGWARFVRCAQVSLSMVIDGRAYAKNGTSVETRLIVADRVEDGAGETDQTFFGSAEGADALSILASAIEDHAPPRAVIAPGALGLSRAGSDRSLIASSAAARKATAQRPVRTRPAASASVASLLAYSQYVTPRINEAVSDVYAAYAPQRIALTGAAPHPTALVESIAMASVAPPAPDAQVLLPARLTSDGVLSDAQLETVVTAAQAHGSALPGRWIISDDHLSQEPASDDDECAVQFRQGFFLGDGTGCGKGRQIAAVIMANWMEGRRRALWISKTDKLLEDAIRDWRDLGGAPTDIRPLSRWKAGDTVTAQSGILFTTYATLRSASERGETRLDQITDWLSGDRPEEARDISSASSLPAFEGKRLPGCWGPVIAFDEAHAMGNAAGSETGRGAQKPSQQGVAGLRLQNAVPEARVLYVSATGATTVENLAYATRLGLWGLGPDYPFASREAFVTAMHGGGVAAMEVVARDLKALGLYTARSLSFDGVEYELMETPLTDRQRRTFDEWAGAFQIIHQNLPKALEATGVMDEDGGCNDARAKSAAMSRFESLKQRFFNHMLTSFKTMPVIEAIRADLEAGHSAVIQLVSTGEALLDRRLATMTEPSHGLQANRCRATEKRADLTIDLTPKEYVLNYLMEAFPTGLQRVVEDESGATFVEPVLDEETGEPVESREAAALRDGMIERLCLLDGAQTALDQIIAAFGPDNVAEVTGRSKRPVPGTDGAGQRIETRSASANLAETSAFMAGEKRILVFSEAGGTGRSYHAALSAPNQQRRIHYLLEPGWKADAAIQGLGRSHRSAQASAPLFRVPSTDVAGEKRFISTIARRLDTLGALTKGQRQTGGQGLFKSEDSLESPIARAALRQFYVRLIGGKTTSIGHEAFETITGLSLVAEDGVIREDLPPMARFLNRMLALEIDVQNAIFGELADLIEARSAIARERGQLDVGVETIRAQTLTVTERTDLCTDERTGAVTQLVTLERRDPADYMTGEAAWRHHQAAVGGYIEGRTGEPVYVHRTAREYTDEGEAISRVKLFSPTRTWIETRTEFEGSAARGDWVEADAAAMIAAWDSALVDAPREIVKTFCMVTGLLTPIWKHLPDDEQRIWRAIPTEGDPVLGRVLPQIAAGRLKAVFSPTEVVSGATALAALTSERQRIPLGDGSTLALRRVGAGDRIEIEAADVDQLSHLKALGCFTEIIAWKTRVFVPFDPADPDASVPLLDRVLDSAGGRAPDAIAA